MDDEDEIDFDALLNNTTEPTSPTRIPNPTPHSDEDDDDDDEFQSFTQTHGLSGAMSSVISSMAPSFSNSPTLIDTQSQSISQSLHLPDDIDDDTHSQSIATDDLFSSNFELDLDNNLEDVAPSHFTLPSRSSQQFSDSLATTVGMDSAATTTSASGGDTATSSQRRLRCDQCGSRNVEMDERGAHMICKECGAILRDVVNTQTEDLRVDELISTEVMREDLMDTRKQALDYFKRRESLSPTLFFCLPLLTRPGVYFFLCVDRYSACLCVVYCTVHTRPSKKQTKTNKKQL